MKNINMSPLPAHSARIALSKGKRIQRIKHNQYFSMMKNGVDTVARSKRNFFNQIIGAGLLAS